MYLQYIQDKYLTIYLSLYIYICIFIFLFMQRTAYRIDSSDCACKVFVGTNGIFACARHPEAVRTFLRPVLPWLPGAQSHPSCGGHISSFVPVAAGCLTNLATCSADHGLPAGWTKSSTTTNAWRHAASEESLWRRLAIIGLGVTCMPCFVLIAGKELVAGWQASTTTLTVHYWGDTKFNFEPLPIEPTRAGQLLISKLM